MQSLEAPAAGKNLNVPDRPPCDEAALAASIYRNLVFVIGKSERHAERRDWFLATSLAVCERLMVPWLEGRRQAAETKQMRVYFLSREFLRAGSVYLNISWAFPKWLPASVRLPTGLMAAR